MGPQELGKLYDEHARTVWLYVRQRVGDAQAQDVVQEAFLRLGRHGGPVGHVRAWLLRVAHNLTLNQVRSGRRRQAHEKRAGAERPGWFEHDGADRLDAQAAQAALAGLDEMDRQIVVLRIWGQLTFQQTADVMGQSVSNVQRRYVDSLRRLRGRLESCRTRTP